MWQENTLKQKKKNCLKERVYVTINYQISEFCFLFTQVIRACLIEGLKPFQSDKKQKQKQSLTAYGLFLLYCICISQHIFF